VIWVWLSMGIVASGLFAQSSRAQPLGQTELRDRQIRADSLKILKRARGLQAGFERRRRYMLPKFYTGTADRCLIVGRFCEWHPRFSEDYVVPDEGKEITRARSEMLRELAKASEAIPGDDWIMGQRIRYLLETHDTSAVAVARGCRATRWWCDALLGISLHVHGDYAAADSAFAVALDSAPAQTRCHWLNLGPLLDDDIRGTYRKMSCAQREAADARIWWISDPLYMVPGNERRTEHFSRVLYTVLQENSVNTYGLSWAGDLAELILRFGWADKWTQVPPTHPYGAGEAVIVGHEREPGYHFFLTQRPPDSIALIADSVFDIYQNPPREQYGPRYTRWFLRLDAQVARFRRGDSTRIVAAYDVSTDTVFGHKRFAAALIATGDSSAVQSKTEVAESPTKNVLAVSTPWKDQLIGVELLAKDSAAAARWRSGFAEIPLDSGRISVSDLLFVDGAPDLPTDLGEATARAHGGTKFQRNTKIGLFWELYGLAPADSTLPVSLTITRADESFLKRTFQALRIAPKSMPLNIRWQENGASGVLSPRSIVLDLSMVPAGKYVVKLQAGDDPKASSSRLIEVQ